ncbi:hypothetical protein [Niveibacterium sp. SC-1]|uniref:hypothetical protein n=1 Tax=Niveibacterium sp. SC-1 TaxID=3135646 RepID=UPI00311F18BA
MSVDVLLDRLEGVRRLGPDRWIAKCPAHEDRHASLSLAVTREQKVLVHDFAGCSVNEVVAAVGLTLAALMPERLGDHLPRERVPVPASDALLALDAEAAVVFIVGSDMRRRREISEADFARLGLAVERIAAARRYVAGSRR